MTTIDPQQYRRRIRAAVISVLVGLGMFGMKITAYFITGSAAILSDAMESVVHVLATSFAFYSVLLSARPADESHPYGHGRIEFFSAGIEGLLIVLAAIAIIFVATPQNQHDRQHHADRKTKEPGELRCIPRNHTTHSLAHRCRMTTVRRPRGKQGTGAGNRGKGAGLRVREPAATPLASSRHSTACPSDELDARRIPLNAPAPRTSQ